MELVKLTLQNFKIHKYLIVEFDSALNIIGGMNETGKSTVVDAIHRALFLKARGTSELINELKSKMYSGDPTTEIVFNSRGITYTLQKTFSNKGTTKLSWPGSKVYQDDEAYTELATIVGTDLNFTMTSSNLASKWEHLIAKQGNSGNDPIGLLQSNYDQLSKKIAEDGGATFIQTLKDTEVTNYFKGQYDKIFTEKGKIITNSNLDSATKSQSNALQKFEQATKVIEDLESARKSYENTLKQIKEFSQQLDDSENDLLELLDQEQQLKQIKNEQEGLLNDIEVESKSLASLENDHKLILENLKLKQDSEKEKSKLEDELVEFSKQKGSIKVEISNLDKEIKEKGLDHLNKKSIFLTALKDKIKIEEEIIQIKERISKKKLLQEKESAIEKSLSSLYNFNEDEFREFRLLETNLATQQAVLATISTSIKVIKSNGKIEINGDNVANSQDFNFTENFKISFDDENILEIIPGGGESLSKAKENFENLAQLLNQLSTKTGTNTSEDYYKSLDGLKNSQRALQAIKDDLLKAEYKNLDEIKHNLEIELESAKVKITAYEQLFTIDQTNIDVEISACDAAISEANVVIAETEGLKENKEKQIIDLDQVINSTNEKIIELQRDLRGIDTVINVTEERVGNEKIRTTKINDLIKKIESLNEELVQIEEKLEKSDVDSKLKRIKLLQESIPKKREIVQELTTEKGRLMGKLEVNGERDPFTAKLIAQEELHIVNENFKSQDNYAKAIALLHDKFKKVKDELADTITKPLADIANVYLREVLGNQVELSIAREEGKLAGLKLIKPESMGGLLDFTSLSGGTKEQVASALRLALAEVLARDFEGKLPVVFDDSFVNSDDGRTEGLNQMLYLAAERGLQVIVLSCHPKAFKELPAKQILLQS